MCLFKWFKKDPVPFDEGFCDVGDGHQIHYMQFGNKKGIPVLCFHGGPGGGIRNRTAGIFDLNKFRVILFSQRGCGKSRFKNLMEENTTLNSVKNLIDQFDQNPDMIIYLIIYPGHDNGLIESMLLNEYTKTLN